MATSYKRTSVKHFPQIGEKITRDAVYWKNLEFPVIKKEYGAVTNIDFSPVEPYNFAVTNSSRVQIYNCRSNQAEKTISKFRQVAYCGSFRSDGLLVAAGGDEGMVKLFDVAGKSLLRTFRGHSGPVHVSKFLTGNLQILSGSDDKTVKLWDIPSESEVMSYNEHTDYIRCGAVSQRSKNIVLTGAYDHTVRLFDTRTDSSVLTIDHGAPVESVLMFPSGGLFISAGGTVVKVWDVLAGGRLVANLSNHHKTVTCMCFGSNHQRLFTGSLDRHVKIYDIASYQVVHSMDYPDAILSVGVEPNDKLIAVGMTSGLLSIQHRKPDTAEKVKKHKKSYSYIVKNKTYIPTADAHKVEHKRREKLEPYDKHFKKFNYSKALDAAIDIRVRSKTPEVTISVIQELIRRGGIKPALAGRDEKSICRIIKFIQKFICKSQFTPVLIDVSTMVLELYTDRLGSSVELQQALQRLKETVEMEMSYMKELIETMGTLETLFAAASSPLETPTNTDNTSIDNLHKTMSNSLSVKYETS
ncbi:unnamed protein product [Owenia fusiformis]|uniref:U3 small nucleolar RNA-associated protein 15 homolog n=1 Tax=Owenia fusiformis TaxID=6347 RepID=A0A8S4Q261_OWEFU|nr:unnamed protein product [Owenia fusiformis]